MDKLTEKLYAKYHLCKNCGTHYGSDRTRENGWCPICNAKYRGFKSRVDPKRKKK